MAGVLDTVNQRTQLVGENRLELLLFRLAGRQVYGINVFKVKEVLPCPPLNELPGSSSVVSGVAHVRGGTMPVLDMNQAIGRSKLPSTDGSFIIITEYNRTTQGFLVGGVERIVNTNWGDIHPPPHGAGSEHYLTAVTKIDEQLVEIIDVEKILAEVTPPKENIDEGIITEGLGASLSEKHILIADDSAVARKQIQRVVESMNIRAVVKRDGKEALEYLEEMVEEGRNPCDEIIMVISDIEMPEMDGYTFTTEVRENPSLKGLHIILHTSLSGVFNASMVKKVGADGFLSKFNPNELAQRVNDRLLAISA